MEFARASSIFNAMEPIVVSFFEEHILPNYPLKCSCEKCTTDIIVLTLNHLKPQYTSTQAGQAYIKALYMNPQLQSDILQELTRSVQIVESKPQHQPAE
ncbi:late competence development ComFB family protein [Cohnella hashimotonis]|uniref:Late competence development ComFB family protein n=1 Tax=Cohnella hashimotonis TaxID=2826895 RepID=A0ABT6TMY8_9BACL|nr:late competence development ComFB family protein [Cohnella hashimotonis]MDI4647633.1 late competence development ComFB family protein [Cohnella hashimotonis]